MSDKVSASTVDVNLVEPSHPRIWKDHPTADDVKLVGSMLARGKRYENSDHAFDVQADPFGLNGVMSSSESSKSLWTSLIIDWMIDLRLLHVWYTSAMKYTTHANHCNKQGSRRRIDRIRTRVNKLLQVSYTERVKDGCGARMGVGSCK